MTPAERRTFWACAAGWTLDAMDFMMFPLVLGTVAALWQVDKVETGFAVTLTLISSAFGGWLAGFLSDRIGRVLTLQITIAWFSLFSLLCAFAQDFTQLTIARVFLGFGFGAEWTAGAILMGETIRAEYRGRAVGLVQSGFAVGWGLAVLLQAICFSLFPQQDAWRYMFVAGALPAILIFFVRRHVKEPPVSIEARALARRSGQVRGLSAIFAPSIVKTTLLASVMSAGALGGYYAIMTWLPSYLTSERGLSVAGSTGYLAMLITGSFVGYLVAAWLSDRIGRRKVFLSFALGAIPAVLLFIKGPLPNQALWFIGFPLGFFATGYFAALGPFLTELYPTAMRGSGQGFCYNFGRGLAAVFPTLVALLSQQTTLANAIALFTTAAYGIFVLAAWALPETKGKVLTADA
jgi:MFS family permease